MTEKIKITRKEVEDLYDIEEDEDSQKDDQVTIKEVPVTETWEEMTERKDKEQYDT